MCFVYQEPSFYLELEFLHCELMVKSLGDRQESYQKCVVEVGSGMMNDTSCNALCTRLGRKEMIYLTMHSTHLIYGYMEREREKCFI